MFLTEGSKHKNIGRGLFSLPIYVMWLRARSLRGTDSNRELLVNSINPWYDIITSL